MNIQLGRAGVHCAAARLEYMGAQCVICDQQGFDIVAFAPEIIRVEVKSTARGPIANNRLEFNTGKGGKKSVVNERQCDVVALVDLLRMRCLFFPTAAITRKNYKLSASRFTLAQEAATWMECVRSTQ